MSRKSGSMERARKTNPGSKAAPQKLCLKSAKNRCLGHRFFDEIRQNPPILLCFQANVTDSLQKSGALDPNLAGRWLFRRDDLLVACSDLLVVCGDLLVMCHMQRSSRHTPYATRPAHLARPSAHRLPRAEVNKTTVSPAIFKQHLNKNFY